MFSMIVRFYSPFLLKIWYDDKLWNIQWPGKCLFQIFSWYVEIWSSFCKMEKKEMVRWNINETSFLSSLLYLNEFLRSWNTNHFYVIPIIGYISTPFLHIYVTVPWKKYITQYSSLFYVSNGNGSRLILKVFCIRYIRKSSWKNSTHQVLEKYISYIIVHCKIFFITICVIWIKFFRNIDTVSLF